MEMHANSNGIEEECIWAVPTYPEESELLTKRMNHLIYGDSEPVKSGWQYNFGRWLSRLGKVSLL